MVQPTSPQVSASPHNSRVWRRRHQRFVISVAVSSIIGSNQKGASWAAQVGTYSCCVPDRESVLNSDLCQDIAQNVPLKMFSGRLGGCSRIPNLGTKINCRFTKDPTTHKKKRSKEPDTHGAPTDRSLVTNLGYLFQKKPFPSQSTQFYAERRRPQGCI